MKRQRIFYANLDGTVGDPPVDTNNINNPPVDDTPPVTPPVEGDKHPVEGDKPPVTPPVEGDKPPVEGAPEKYADFKFPNGVIPETEVISKFTEFAKRDNLSQAKAQEYLDLANSLVLKTAESIEQNREKAIEELNTTWDNELQADKVYGGLKYKETVTRANRALKTFTDAMGEDGKELLSLFSKGSIKHPAMFKFLATIDKATNATPVSVGTPPPPPPQKKTQADIMYG